MVQIYGKIENMNIAHINAYYERLIRGIDLLVKGDFTSLYCLSKPGLGKSYVIDQTLNELKADYVLFKGDMSLAKLFAFLQENKKKIIVMRDVGRLLRNIGFIETLKAITDPGQKRVVSRLVYASHEGVEESFEFEGSIILELNDISKRYKEDIEALISRGLLVELNFSIYDIINLMRLISKDEATEYLISKSNILGVNTFSLRLQNLVKKIYESANRDKLEWKHQIDLILNTQIPWIRKELYRFAGNNLTSRIEFVKYLMKEGMSYSTAERKITEGLITGDIFSDNKLKQAKISINPFK